MQFTSLRLRNILRRSPRLSAHPPPPLMEQTLVISCDNAAGTRPWSDLPDLALHAIAMKLTSPFAYTKFAGVCKSWRSVAESAKSGFIASQPPLLMILPPLFRASPIRFYSLVEDKFYRATSPTLSSVLEGFSYLGHSHGYLIMLGASWERIPTLVNPWTGERLIDFPSTRYIYFSLRGGLLTAPPDSGDSLLILYDYSVVYYCRAGDSSWHVIPSPSPLAGMPESVAVPKGRLYVSTSLAKVMEVDISAHRPELIQVIDTPEVIQLHDPGRTAIPFHVLVESNGELLMISGQSDQDLKDLKVHRLEFPCVGGAANWVKGLGGRSVFMDCDIGSKGRYIFSRRMKGVKENYVYQACEGGNCLFLLGNDDGKTGRFESHRRDLGEDQFRVWVHPGDLKQWGFTF